MRNFIWLIFLGNGTTNVQFKHLIIPYDCEFIVIQSKNGRIYTLTEIFTVKNQFFSLDFGTYVRGLGLQTEDGGFYNRRSNLHKIGLRVVDYLDTNVRSIIKLTFQKKFLKQISWIEKTHRKKCTFELVVK